MKNSYKKIIIKIVVTTRIRYPNKREKEVNIIKLSIMTAIFKVMVEDRHLGLVQVIGCVSV